ncbi:MAG TPA: SAM-dependent methyltransferase [Burkholderiales bacterium]
MQHATSPSPLPAPAADALAHSGRVTAHIGAEIAAAGGWLAFERYMDLALYAPGLGYYAAGAAKFGAAGDFVTAPEISSLFGQSLARQVAQVLAASSPHVLEFGAGTGKLAADVLNSLGAACQSYAILEPSPDLRARQAETLRRLAPAHTAKARWLDQLPAQFAGAVIANEVIDAMPVHLVHASEGDITERGVTLDAENRFAWADRPASGTVLDEAQTLGLNQEHDYLTEINLAARAWVTALAGMLTKGAALIIDYGFPAREYYHPQRNRGTLMCHYRHHAHADPFLWPGLTDITAHVDFTALADSAEAAGLALAGYTSQAAFLLDCGLTDLLAQVPAADSARYLPLTNQANRLISPAEMGELFKVMLLTRDLAIEPLGFRSSDRSHRL